MSNSIVFTGGIGDVFALTSLLTDEEIKSLETIYFACRGGKVLAELFNQSPTFLHVKTVVLPSGDKTYFEIKGVREDFDIPFDCEDWSISKRFPESFTRVYRDSPLLQHVPFPDHLLPEYDDYIVCQHETPINGKTKRDLTLPEWNRLLARLEQLDEFLVVLNTSDSNPPPKHPLVIDLRGKTTLAESIAILSHSKGFWGIASCLSTLACQEFSGDPEALWIKGSEDFLWMHRYIYCAPFREFPFLYKNLMNDSPIQELNTVMQYKDIVMLENRYYNGPAPIGAVISMPAQTAEHWVKAGVALYHEPKPIVTNETRKLRTATRYPKGN